MLFGATAALSNRGPIGPLVYDGSEEGCEVAAKAERENTDRIMANAVGDPSITRNPRKPEHSGGILGVDRVSDLGETGTR